MLAVGTTNAHRSAPALGCVASASASYGLRLGTRAPRFSLPAAVTCVAASRGNAGPRDDHAPKLVRPWSTTLTCSCQTILPTQREIHNTVRPNSGGHEFKQQD